jgi:hypothetical protein
MKKKFHLPPTAQAFTHALFSKREKLVMHDLKEKVISLSIVELKLFYCLHSKPKRTWQKPM